MIRISGGALRGRRLRVPASARPTTELARKAAFDILGPAIRGARVLDAAAGSGAYGVEALSRGAREAVFVESDRGAARALERSLGELGVAGAARVFVEPVARFARDQRAGVFDVVFHDPPWDADARPDVAALLERIAPGGVLFHERGDDAEPLPERAADETRRYGRTHFFIYRSPRAV